MRGRVFIVRSGSGYFTGFFTSGEQTTPQMTSDPLCAMRMGWGEIGQIISKMGQLGFVAEIVELIRARHRQRSARQGGGMAGTEQGSAAEVAVED